MERMGIYLRKRRIGKPIQDRVFTAIEEYAREKNYAFIFDKAGDLTIVYADARYDINDDILLKLGIVVGEK